MQLVLAPCLHLKRKPVSLLVSMTPQRLYSLARVYCWVCLSLVQKIYVVIGGSLVRVDNVRDHTCT